MDKFFLEDIGFRLKLTLTHNLSWPKFDYRNFRKLTLELSLGMAFRVNSTPESIELGYFIVNNKRKCNCNVFGIFCLLNKFKI